MAALEEDALAAVRSMGVVLLNVPPAQVRGCQTTGRAMPPAAAYPGMGAFIGLVALPALIFKAVATLDFGAVRIDVCIALFAGKAILIVLSLLLGRFTSTGAAGEAELKAGVFALLTTNSDDLGLGLPVLGAIFPPELVNMCFVLNALQTMIFHPILLVFSGIGVAERDAPTDGTPPASNVRAARPRAGVVSSHRHRRLEPASSPRAAADRAA